MPQPPTTDNPRGYILTSKNEADLARAQNATTKEISQDVDTLAKSIGVSSTTAIRTVTGSATQNSSDRDVTTISSSNSVFTLLSPSSFVLGVDYVFTKIGAGTLTLSGTIYDSGGEMSSYPLTDGQSLVVRRYFKTTDGSVSGIKAVSLLG